MGCRLHQLSAKWCCAELDGAPTSRTDFLEFQHFAGEVRQLFVGLHEWSGKDRVQLQFLLCARGAATFLKKGWRNVVQTKTAKIYGTAI